MKILICALLVLAASPAFAGWSPSGQSLQNGLMTYIRENQDFQDRAISKVIRSRCKSYLPLYKNMVSARKEIVRRCESLGPALIEVLKPSLVEFEDSSSGSRAVEPAVFPEDLLALTESPVVASFLEQLLSDLELATLAPIEVDLFKTALAFSGSNLEAMRWIAVLFQDTSPVKTHLAWIKQEVEVPSEIMVRNVELLERATDRLIEVFNGKLRLKAKLQVYPAHVQSLGQTAINYKLYHYYVPAYLSRRLVERGYPKREAFFASFLFNYLYEVFQQGNAALRVFTEPKGIDSFDTARDIYLGYRGAIDGVDGFKSQPIPPAEFIAHVRASPISALYDIVLEVSDTGRGRPVRAQFRTGDVRTRRGQ